MEEREFNPNEMIGKIIELRETPGFIWEDNEAGEEDTPVILNGRYEVIEWDPGNYEFGLVTEEEGEINRTIPDDQPFVPTIYWVSSDYVDVPEEIVNEVDELEKAFEVPSVEHPLGPHTGAKVEWKNDVERFRDGRKVGSLSKTPEGDWVIQVAINSRNPNSRSFPEPGEEVLVKKGNDYYSMQVLERVFPGDEKWRVNDDIYSWWTFKDDSSNTRETKRVIAMEEYNAEDMLGKWTVLDEAPAVQIYGDVYSGDYELGDEVFWLSGKMMVLGWDGESHGFVVGEMDDDGNPILNEMYMVRADFVVPADEAEAEIDKLDEQYGMPAVDHPLGEHTGNISESEIDKGFRSSMERIYRSLLEVGYSADEAQAQIKKLISEIEQERQAQEQPFVEDVSLDRQTMPEEHLGWHTAADDNYFTIDLGRQSALLGLIDVLNWAKRNMEDIDVTELSDYVNDLYSADDFILRLNASQFSQIRDAFYNFMNAIEELDSREEFEEVYPDFELEDIWEAEDKIMGAEMEPSSGKGLEDIPTMEKNPEDLKEGEVPTIAPEPQDEPEDNGLEDCPQCGLKDAVDPTYQECENCGWDKTNACPDCLNDRSITIDEFGSKRCNNCGWAEELEHPAPGPDTPGVLPPLTDAAKKIQSLEDVFAAPSVEHPLGPHTGAEEGGQELYTSGRFVNLAKWPSNPVWGVEINPAAGQRDPMPGDLATIQQKSKAFNRPVPVTLVNDMGGAWTFKNGHHPA